jgi:nucleotide-binding universal stress UspA family protein
VNEDIPMSAADTLVSTTEGAGGELPLQDGVLLATMGGPGSDPAARLAHLFAIRRNVPIEALAVLEPPSSEALLYAPSYVNINQELRHALTDAVETQLRRTSNADNVPLAIEEGRPADCIASRAKARGAALIAMGIGRHDPVDRLLGVEPAIAVLHRTSVPVLAASGGTRPVLRSIVIATDFSPASARAAQLALAFAADDATVHFVHAWPWMDLGGTGAPTWFNVYETGVKTLIDELIRSLVLPPKARVVTHLEHGEAPLVIRQIATAHWADLIALGSHGRGLFDRLTLGSVAEDVLRKAQCSVLIAPPTPSEKE